MPPFFAIFSFRRKTFLTENNCYWRRRIGRSQVSLARRPGKKGQSRLIVGQQITKKTEGSLSDYLGSK